MSLNPPSRKNFIWLDIARAVAAMIVLGGHLRAFVFHDSVASTHLGAAWKAFYFVTSMQHQAVVVFFVLSGFLITKTISEQAANGKWSWRMYAVKRLSRLWIVLFPALVLTLIWDQLGIHITGSTLYSGGLNAVNHSTPIGPLSYSPWTFFGNVFFLQTIAVPEFGTDVPLWSLANEFWYYILFPLFFFALIPTYNLALRVALGVTGAILCIWVVPAQLLLGIVWLFGYGAYLLHARTDRLSHTSRSYLAIAAAVVFGAVLVASKVIKLGDVTQDYITGVSFALLLVPLAGLGVSDLIARPAKLFASFSYTLYVAHFPFLAFLTSLFLHNVRVAPGVHGLATFATLFVTVMLYAYAVSLVFEGRTPAIQAFFLRSMGGMRLTNRSTKIVLSTE